MGILDIPPLLAVFLKDCPNVFFKNKFFSIQLYIWQTPTNGGRERETKGAPLYSAREKLYNPLQGEADREVGFCTHTLKRQELQKATALLSSCCRRTHIQQPELKELQQNSLLFESDVGGEGSGLRQFWDFWTLRTSNSVVLQPFFKLTWYSFITCFWVSQSLILLGFESSVVLQFNQKKCRSTASLQAIHRAIEGSLISRRKAGSNGLHHSGGTHMVIAIIICNMTLFCQRCNSPVQHEEECLLCTFASKSLRCFFKQQQKLFSLLLHNLELD